MFDAITEVASYAQYATLSERLRALGLTEDSSEGAPTCRWRFGELILDVMPTDERVLGFSNRWYPSAISSAQVVQLAGLNARVITPVYFLATKLEAFQGRGMNDYRASHDLEDVMAVVDGRPEIVEELRAASADVRTYIATKVRALLGTRTFVDALPGFLSPDPASQLRHPLILERLKALESADK
jgi:hypothetical protein